MQKERSISEANSVFAVFSQDRGLFAREGGRLLFAAWPDGYIVWSGDRVKGGAPYRAGKIDSSKYATLQSRFEKEALFTEKALQNAYIGPDLSFITILIRSDRKQVVLQSWHELVEASSQSYADQYGSHKLIGKTRLQALQSSSKEYQVFRKVWGDTRRRLNDLIPKEGQLTTGKLLVKSGFISWVDK